MAANTAPRQHTKLLSQTLDGRGDDTRRDPFSSRVHNAYGRHARNGENDGEAIRRDHRQRKMGTIGDEAISWRSPHQLRIIGLAQDNDTIAMNLPQCHELTEVDTDGPTEPGSVAVDARRVCRRFRTPG